MTPALLPHRALWACLATALLATGCNKDEDDDGDGDSVDAGPWLVLDEAEVQARMDRIVAVAPTCVEVSAADPAAAGPPPPPAGVGATGSCGGSLDVTSDHADGVTSYRLAFNDLCLQGDVSDAVLSGVVEGVENGTPTDSGPVIDSLVIRTDGALRIAHDAAVMELTIGELRVDYGSPATWEPGVPTEAAPDQVQLDRATIHFPNGEEPDLVVQGLTAERVGVVPEVTILGGQLISEGDGYVEISTPPNQPLTISTDQAEAGALILTGSDDTRLVGVPVPGAPLSPDLVLNGSPMDTKLDCSASYPQTIEAVLGLLGALPLY